MTVKRRVSLVAVIVSAACFATLAILTNKAYALGAQPLQLLTWRFMFAALLMAAVQASRGHRALFVRPLDVGRFSLLSLTGYGAASLCFFFALKYVDASVVAVLLYTYPALVALISRVVFGEGLGASRVLAIVMTFAGCSLVLRVFEAGQVIDPRGILLGLGAALGYSMFNLLSARWLGDYPRMVLMTYTFGLSAAGMGLVSVLTGSSLSVAGWPPTLWGLLAAIVVVPTFFAVVLYLEGIKGLGAPQAAIVSTFEPLFTIVLAAIFLGDRLSATQIAGALLVVAGVAAAEWRPGASRTEEFATV